MIPYIVKRRKGILIFSINNQIKRMRRLAEESNNGKWVINFKHLDNLLGKLLKYEKYIK